MVFVFNEININKNYKKKLREAELKNSFQHPDKSLFKSNNINLKTMGSFISAYSTMDNG